MFFTAKVKIYTSAARYSLFLLSFLSLKAISHGNHEYAPNDQVSTCRLAQLKFLKDDDLKLYWERQFIGKDQSEASFFVKLFNAKTFDRKKATIVDVGANIGQIFSDSYAAGRVCHCDGRTAGMFIRGVILLLCLGN